MNHVAVLHKACFNGDLSIARDTTTTHVFTTIEYDVAFQNACAGGHLHMTKWLIEVCPTINIHSCRDYAFKAGCCRGQITVIKWFNDRWPISDQLAISSFQISLLHNQMDVAKWLFEICPEISNTNLDTVFAKVCVKNYIDVAKYLLAIRPINHTINDNFTFKSACEVDRLELFNLLLPLYNNNDAANLINISFERRNYDAVLHIVYYFDISQLEIDAKYQQIFDDLIYGFYNLQSKSAVKTC